MLAAAPAAACSTAATGAGCANALGHGSGLNRGGGKWLSVTPAPPPVEIGDTLPKRYMLLTNTRYYGLPPAGDGWKYYRVEREVYRVENGTRRVLEKVTHWTNRRFP